MSLLKKTIIFLTGLTLLFLISSREAPVYAQDDPYPEPPVECDDVRPNLLKLKFQGEFHSLRPYQASATCLAKTENYATFCGNTLTLQQKIDVTYQPGVDDCSPIAGGKVRCNYTISVPRNPKVPNTITIKLSGANLPIMGNTEEVTNYKGKPDQLTDAQKVNGYVSWYLNGVNNRAEYPFLNPTEATDASKLVNFSGPLNKLLPQDVQVSIRINTINQAKVTRHDQIVACTFPILGIPVPCYDNRLLSYVLNKERLTSWNGNISSLPTLPTTWNDRIPPQRKDFSDYTAYYKALREWRGQSCGEFTIPIIGTKILLCYDNPLRPNYWASLFPYIPLSSTEDLEGNIKIDPTSLVGSAGVTNVTFSNQTPATLFFSHIQESSELGSILQNTYLAKGEAEIGPDTAVSPPSSCTTVDVRSNKGDNLFATSISGDLSYTASFTCDFNPPSCNTKVGNYCNKLLGTCVQPGSDWTCMIPLGQKDCPSGYTCKLGCFCNPPTQTCSKNISIALSTSSNTPKIDDVWSRLVGGPTAIVKRMFPKLGTQIGTLKDIPGSTSITYSGAQASSGELNLPHLGGISEYFLKGIQTMLRPKGYGETISFGETTGTACTPGSAGNIPNLPAGSGACKLTSTSIGGVTLPPTMVSILEAAAQSYHVPPGLILGVMFGESAFNNPGKYDWTEDNVKKWSMGCAAMPGCSPNSFPSTGVVPFSQSNWNGLGNAVAVVDPDREPNACNLLDAIFALAKGLNQSQNGSSAFAGKTCYGIALNAGGGGSGSCSWNSSDYETAIRVWEFGTAYNSTYTCATKPGSCATGGGAAAACPVGDLCETVSGSGNTSHNACVWNVAHSH